MHLLKVIGISFFSYKYENQMWKNEIMLIKEIATMKPSMYYYVRMLVMGIEVVVKFTTSFILILQVHLQWPLLIFVIYIR